MRKVKSLLKQTTPSKFAVPHSLIHRSTHNLAHQKNWILLLGQISPSASSSGDLGTRLELSLKKTSESFAEIMGNLGSSLIR